MRPAVFVLVALLSITVPARSIQAARMTDASVKSGCFAPLTLLATTAPVPGVQVRNGPPAPDIPPGPAVVHLPLYPGAVPSTAVLPVLDGADFPHAYRKIASATFSLPARYTTVSAWYRTALTACGQPIEGDGPLQHGLASLAAFSENGLNRLFLTLRSVSPHTTEVRYVDEVLSLPPRPAASYLHGPFVNAIVVYRTRGVIPGSDRVYRYTITWPATLSRLTTTINRPTRIFVPNLDGGGAVVFTESATISFQRADGGVRTVRVGGDLFKLTVGRARTLADANGRVINLISRITHRRCGPRTACR